MHRILFAFTIVFAIVPTVIVADSPPEGTMLSVDLTHLSDRPGKYMSTTEDTLNLATKAQLVRLRQHENWGVALQAAWEGFVRRPVRQKLQEQGEVKKADLAEPLERWLGFAEGRLRLTLPAEWETVVRGGLPCNTTTGGGWPLTFNTTDCNCHWKGAFLDNLKPPPEDEADNPVIGDEFDIALDVTWKREDKTLILSDSKKLSVRVNLDWFESQRFDPVNDEAPWYGGRVLWHRHAGVDLVAIMPGLGGKYELVAIDCQTNRQLWKAQVVGGGRGPGMTGIPSHLGPCVDLVFSQDEVYLFGQHLYSVYIEGFRLKDGKAVGRFSSSGPLE